MCGICGYINLARGEIADRDVLDKMCRKLTHRGPDDQGLYVEEFCALGQRRLSIIDLAGGHQPLFNETGDIVIVYNGEVYNFRNLRPLLEEKGHRFSTNTDTETIVHAFEEWGKDCLDRFNGMFAFCIWDKRNERLFLARDRMGKKPLYYTVMNNTFVFASELKALLVHPEVRRELSLTSLSSYLAFEYIPAPYTIFENIYKLEPGHFFEINMLRPLEERKRIRTQQYWDIPFKPEQHLQEEIEEEFLDKFRNAVKARLISDVPLGVFLSGGIDSSSVVAMMAELMPPHNIKTFSIGFEEKSFDESSYARTVAKFFGTDHREDMLKPHVLLDILPEVCDIIDEPFADSSIIPTYLLSKFTRQHVTVALGGDGGDELFAGYDPFRAHYPAKYLDAFPPPIVKMFHRLSTLLPVSTRNISFDFALKQFLSAMNYKYGRRHFAWLGSFKPDIQHNLLHPDVLSRINHFDPFRIIDDLLSRVKPGHELDGIIYLYCKLYLQDDILVKVDRASMATSLEVRAPFLDKNVVEFVGTIPNSLKLHRLTTKFILKKIMEKKIPREIVYRKKKGFGIPIADWFRGELKPLLIEHFNPEKVKRMGLFNHDYINQLMQEHFRMKRDNRKQLWTLFIFSQWYDRYMK